MMKPLVRFVALIAIASAYAVSMHAQQKPVLGYDDTPMQPDGKWRVHDIKRPHPPVVAPGPASATPMPAPADATVLLGQGEDVGAWQMMDGAPITWVMKAGVLPTGKGMIRTRDEFTDFQLHV